MQIAVIGTGYVGLVTGACFAEFGTSVTCVDVDADKIARLNDGQIPIYEPGLDQIVSKNKAAGRLNFTTDIRSAVEQSLVSFSPSARRQRMTAPPILVSSRRPR